jgi:5-formyltetrahydrofolate cyclo-ligase
MASQERKTEIRKASLEARRALSALERAQASEEIAARALGLPEVISARAVLAYAALPEEVDPAALVAVLRAAGARIALPRVCGPAIISLHWVDEQRPLIPGPYGILEPDAACAVAAASELDLVLVPGVAFDRGCRRLGFGGGFYDALLASLPASTPKIGLAFQEQLCDEVPVEAHDVPLDAVITPRAMLRPGSGGEHR